MLLVNTDYIGNRLTRRLPDSRIASRLDAGKGHEPLEKLWRYECTGYEPEEIPMRESIQKTDLKEWYHYLIAVRFGYAVLIYIRVKPGY
jgi:hypothetical protein